MRACAILSEVCGVEKYPLILFSLDVIPSVLSGLPLTQAQGSFLYHHLADELHFDADDGIQQANENSSTVSVMLMEGIRVIFNIISALGTHGEKIHMGEYSRHLARWQWGLDGTDTDNWESWCGKERREYTPMMRVLDELSLTVQFGKSYRSRQREHDEERNQKRMKEQETRLSEITLQDGIKKGEDITTGNTQSPPLFGGKDSPTSSSSSSSSSNQLTFTHTEPEQTHTMRRSTVQPLEQLFLFGGLPLLMIGLTHSDSGTVSRTIRLLNHLLLFSKAMQTKKELLSKTEEPGIDDKQPTVNKRGWGTGIHSEQTERDSSILNDDILSSDVGLLEFKQLGGPELISLLMHSKDQTLSTLASKFNTKFLEPS